MLILKAYKPTHHFIATLHNYRQLHALTGDLVLVPFCFMYSHLFMAEEITASSIMFANRLLN